MTARRPTIPALALLAAVLLAAVPPAPARAADAVPPEVIAVSAAEFSRPHDVALTPDGLYLLVADVGNHAIKILVPGELRVIGTIGEGELSSPHDVTVGPDGRVYVADTGNDRIVVYDFGGVSRYGGVMVERAAVYDEGLSSPEGVAVDADGRIYVANPGDHSVVVLKDGRVTARITESGAPPTGLARPHDVDTDRRGQVFVTDPGNDRVLILDRDLAFTRALEGPAYGFDEPKYLAWDEHGLLFVADERNHRIVIVGGDGAAAGQIGTGERGDGPGQLDAPEGVAVAGRYIWISDTRNHRLLLLRRCGALPEDLKKLYPCP